MWMLTRTPRRGVLGVLGVLGVFCLAGTKRVLGVLGVLFFAFGFNEFVVRKRLIFFWTNVCATMLLVMASTLPVIAVKLPVIAVTVVPWRRTFWFWGNLKALAQGGSRSSPPQNARHGAEANYLAQQTRAQAA